MNPEVFLRGENRNVIKFLWNIDHFSQEKTLGTLDVKFIHLNLLLKCYDTVLRMILHLNLDTDPITTETLKFCKYKILSACSNQKNV